MLVEVSNSYLFEEHTYKNTQKKCFWMLEQVVHKVTTFLLNG